MGLSQSHSTLTAVKIEYISLRQQSRFPCARFRLLLLLCLVVDDGDASLFLDSCLSVSAPVLRVPPSHPQNNCTLTSSVFLSTGPAFLCLWNCSSFAVLKWLVFATANGCTTNSPHATAKKRPLPGRIATCQIIIYIADEWHLRPFVGHSTLSLISSSLSAYSNFASTLTVSTITKKTG